MSLSGGVWSEHVGLKFVRTYVRSRLRVWEVTSGHEQSLAASHQGGQGTVPSEGKGLCLRNAFMSHFVVNTPIQVSPLNENNSDHPHPHI